MASPREPTDPELLHEVAAMLRDRAGPQALPRHRHGLERRRVALVQRARILVATAEVIAESSYADAPASEIIKRAGVSSKTFYGQFADKEAAFEAMFDLLDDLFLDELLTMRDTDPLDLFDLPELAEAARIFVAVLARYPLLTRVRYVAQRGPSRVEERLEETQLRFATGLCDLAVATRAEGREVELPSLMVSIGIQAAIAGMIRHHIKQHGVESLVDLQVSITELIARAFIPAQWEARVVEDSDLAAS